MSSDFYLWSKEILKISDKNLKYIDNRLEPLLKNYGVLKKEDYDKIINKISMEINLRNKFLKTNYSPEVIFNMKKEMKSYGVEYITYEDSRYPKQLKEIYDPPHVIYYIGDIDLLSNQHSISVIGSRICSDYGKNACKYFVSNLSQKGFIIISGMAKGIDSLAHRYCIDNNSKTIAVMGTSIDDAYPKSASSLKREIVDKGGLVLSEHKIGKRSYSSFFALRNRIIAGLSSGILVIEAKRKSGTSITIDCGLQYGKNIYVVPGSIFSELSLGCNKMIQEGAKPVSNIEDITEDYYDYLENIQKKYDKVLKNSGNCSSSCVNIGINEGNIENDLSNMDKKIMEILVSNGVQDLDNLSIKTGYAIDEVLFHINKLLILGFIVEEGFNRYAPNILK